MLNVGAERSRGAELELLRGALAAEVPVLGVGIGAQLLAVAAGGAVRHGQDAGIGRGTVRTAPAAGSDPLFAGVPPEPSRLRYWHGDTVDLPAGAVVLASDERRRVRAFRIGGSAWGLHFPVEADTSAGDGPARSTPEQLPGLLLARFAALVTARAEPPAGTSRPTTTPNGTSSPGPSPRADPTGRQARHRHRVVAARSRHQSTVALTCSSRGVARTANAAS